MHVMFVHQNFPAQFGHIAAHLVDRLGWRCTFVSERDPGVAHGIEKVHYTRRFSATRHNSYYTRTFETAVGHAEAVYRAVRARKDLRPDLVVGHSGFGSTIMLPEVLDCPIINFFEYFYRPHDSDMDFRPDSAASERKFLRSRVRNAMILLDMVNCHSGYTPTQFQRGVFPERFHDKLDVVFDGVETDVFHRIENPPRTFAGRTIGPDTRIVTYCSRGFEKMRGFDIFMKAARIIYQRHPNVIFLVAGTDRVCYGGDTEQTGGKPLRHWLLSQEKFDLSKFVFTGWLSKPELAAMLSLGDAHIYLTVPFVLSWSMMNALACGAVVVGSDTAPVQEMITHGHNGFLADFFEPEAIADQVLEVLKDPPAYQPIRENAQQFIEKDYALAAVLPRMLNLYENTIAQYKSDRARKSTADATRRAAELARIFEDEAQTNESRP